MGRVLLITAINGVVVILLMSTLKLPSLPKTATILVKQIVARVSMVVGHVIESLGVGKMSAFFPPRIKFCM